MKKILLVEDEKNVASFVKKGLEEEDFTVAVANDGAVGWNMAKTERYDLVILDRMLPGMDGMEICNRIREKYKYEIPVIMLTALGSTEDVIAGLNEGANDYITKPFHLRELTARVRSIFRQSEAEKGDVIYRIADLELNDDTKTVTRAGDIITLTSKEYRLLLYFLKNIKRVLSREQILENVWNVEFDMGTNTVDVYINYLRNKIDKKYTPKLIHTVIGMGYVMKEA
ncbi:MAG: response regulator transcription factor [Rikenellaceae bacterium]|nr:response regulator transcription factor [Rikenellaceae bacterium]